MFYFSRHNSPNEKNQPLISTKTTSVDPLILWNKLCKIKLLRWIEEYERLSRMTISLFEHQIKVSPTATKEVKEIIEKRKPDIIENFDTLMKRINRKTKRNEHCFSVLYTLHDILLKFESIILLDPIVSSYLFRILVEFAHTSSFDCSHFHILNFLKSHYNLREFNMKNLFHVWKKSDYYNQNLLRGKDFNLNSQSIDGELIEVVYCEPIKNLYMQKFNQNLYFIPPILDLATYNSKFFIDFLIKYNINHAGPFQVSESAPKIRYFISSTYEMDKYFNSGNALFGCFDIPSNSLNFRPEVAANYLSSLPKVPKWIIDQLSPFEIDPYRKMREDETKTETVSVSNCFEKTYV